MFEAKYFRRPEYLKKKKSYKPNRYRVSVRKYSGSVRWFFLILLILGISYLIIRNLILSGRYNISKISLEGARRYVNKTDLETLLGGQVLGKNIFLVDPQEISKVIYNNFLGVRNVEVKKVYPEGLKVYVEERVPTVRVCNRDSTCFFIDEEAFVLGEVGSENSDLPKIRYEYEILVGHFLEEDIIPVSFEILSQAEKNKVNISSMSYHPRYSEMFVGEGAKVYMGNSKNISDAMKIVAVLLRKEGLEGKNIKKIDLRYDKVVVSYE